MGTLEDKFRDAVGQIRVKLEEAATAYEEAAELAEQYGIPHPVSFYAMETVGPMVLDPQWGGLEPGLAEQLTGYYGGPPSWCDSGE
jgi:hypothetical protein